ncbi:MAG: uracil-DNA glycosylase [Clostridium sp.]|nr:uracil-DNA glycosylase [Clostridium sp.]
MPKSEKLNELYMTYRKVFDAEDIVLGDGNINSRMVLVGEAPGREEVQQGKPFVGAAGKNLMEFLNRLEVKRENIYITNTIKYRLSKVNTDTGRIINRASTKKEIEENRGYLLKEINIIRPEFIITLGNTPLYAISGRNIKIGDVHGKIQKIDVLGIEYKLFPLYHPASIIYNRKLKVVYYEDIEKLREITR